MNQIATTQVFRFVGFEIGIPTTLGIFSAILYWYELFEPYPVACGINNIVISDQQIQKIPLGQNKTEMD